MPNARFLAARSSLLPIAAAPGAQDSLGAAVKAAEAACRIVSNHRGELRAADTYESAARHRRQQFRLSRAADDEDDCHFSSEVPSGDDDGASLDVMRQLVPPDLVCFHPPTPYLDPLTAIVTPLSLHGHTASSYYHRDEIVNDLARQLRSLSLDQHSSSAERELFVAAVLPVSVPFVPGGVYSARASTHPLEALLRRDGIYDVVHRRCFSRSQAEAEALAAQALGAAAPHVPQLVGQLLGGKEIGDDAGHWALHQQLRQELAAWFQSSSLETIVFRRRLCGPRDSTPSPTKRKAASTPLSFEDTFEHDNYLPAKPGAPTAMADHWTSACGPSFSYLQSEFEDETQSAPLYFASTAERQLAARRRAQMPTAGPRSDGRHSPIAQYDQNAHVAFSAMFSADARAQRRGKVRKMATQLRSKQGWFLDEKLLKSHAAEVALANELARLEVPEPD
jgi:hypothetical protein